MKRRKVKIKRKTRRKKKSEAYAKHVTKVVAVLAPRHAGHSAEATATNKAALLKALSIGMAPGEAAEAIGIGRSTAFTWKQNDAEFSAKWDEARETAWDRLEGRMYSLGMDGEVSALEKTLKAYRPERWREPKSEDRAPGTQNNWFLNVTMREHAERLQRLGLPVPVIESDREEDYAPDNEANHS
jgi:hypothetical protein